MFSSSGDGKQTETSSDLICPTSTLANAIPENLMYLIAALNIFLSITAFLGNALILIALRKESSLHPPSKLLFRCLATTDLFVGLTSEPLDVTYLLSLIHKDWNLCCFSLFATFIVAYTLGSVSLCTLTAIGFDRLLALKLALRYSQVVTLKRTYMVVSTIWVMSVGVSLSYLVDRRITIWYSYIFVPLCLTISSVSYTKIFRALRWHQTRRVQQQQRSETAPLNIARYRKAVHSALWVQLALVVCYLPFGVASTLFYRSLSSSYFLPWQITMSLVFFNSSLNPFLYCWKISEVRQAVKETIKQAFCCL